ncbi:hypothetical protein IEQ34_021875 [Dendrobium chrysotoxum]|uniref:DOG1 domain-containing protein n=1 Tax=Dendrobium chrysotoxum TaxID=161865 RepID=A0AAV7FVX0_DENCH|nr:hypothetical protein IEQ34_021875 [Dendrobium chrysotoxum]
MRSKEGGAYDLGELDQALFLYLDGQDHSSVQEHRRESWQRDLPVPFLLYFEHEFIYAETLNIFPSQPMHVEPFNKGGVISLNNASNNSSKRPADQSMELGNRRNNTSSLVQPDKDNKAAVKAYVQQLENSRIRLTQLEQELQRARAQGVFFGGGALLGDQGLAHGINSLSSEATMFDMEFARWLEEHHRLMCELRAAVQEHLPEHELRLYVDHCLSHYDEMINLKGAITKADVFHLLSGMWKTPAERCFMWMGGFRPSELIKILLSHIEPLTEQQILGICGLQQSTQETEEALSQGLEALHQSLSETIASDALSSPSNMANYMGHMAIAMNKLSTLEGFVRQADGLRQQTLHRLHQILTIRQAARCFLSIAEYFHRLRALSSLWLARPRQE